jgi:sulfoxide reductase heme-binding subunit YedZ
MIERTNTGKSAPVPARAIIDRSRGGAIMFSHNQLKRQSLTARAGNVLAGIARGGEKNASTVPATRLQSLISKANKILFALYLVPGIYLLWGVQANALGANPAEVLINQSGLWSLRLLWLTLSITPLRKITGWHWLIRLRRVPALFCFFYANLHLLFYLAFEQTFGLAEIITDISQKPYIAVGFVAFLLLVPLAITSTDAMKRRLGGNNWRNLHRLAYVAAIASAFHYLLLVKRDIGPPAIYIVLLALLFLLRLVKLPIRSTRQGLS